MRRVLLGGILLLIAAAAAWWVIHPRFIDVPFPARGAGAPPPSIPDSTVTVLFTAPNELVRTSAESGLPTAIPIKEHIDTGFNWGSTTGNSYLSIDANIARLPVSIGWGQDGLSWEVPLELAGSAVYDSKILGGIANVFIPKDGQPKPVLRVRGVSALTFDDTWTPTATSKLKERPWDPGLTFRVDLRGIAAFPGVADAKIKELPGRVDGFVGPQADAIPGKIDAKIKEVAPALQSALMGAWRDMQSVQPIEGLDRGWFVLRPLSDTLALDILGGATSTALRLSFKARPSVEVGSKPQIPLLEVPGKRAETQSERAFSITLPATVTQAEIERRLRSELVGKPTFSADTKKSITTKELDVSISGEFLVVTLVVEGDFNARIHLLGKLAYDLDRQEVFVRDFEYSLETRNLVLKAFDWLDHSGLRDGVAKRLVVPIADRLRTAKETTSAALNREIRKGLSIKTTMIGQLDLRGFRTTPTDVTAVFTMAGEMEVIASE